MRESERAGGGTEGEGQANSMLNAEPYSLLSQIS